MTITAVHALSESDRLNEYARRQHTWPLQDSEFVPSTDGWRNLLQRRFQQVDQLTADDGSYDGYINTLISAMSPNYTEFGWALSRAPEKLWHDLDSHLRSTNVFDHPLEEVEEAIQYDDDSQRPIFVSIPSDLQNRVLHELQPLLEAWSGTALVPYTTYGLRVYRNTSKLYMHLDSPGTRVISAILHVGHDTRKPWPLVIEDFDGITNEVQLDAGDVLLYESSKCWHGRPRRMDGNWYTSVFVHYYPQNFPLDLEQFDLDVHHRVPPHWKNKVGPQLDSFQMVDTACLEPQCPDEWCALKESNVVKGPGPDFGAVLTAHGKIQKLNLPHNREEL